MAARLGIVVLSLSATLIGGSSASAATLPPAAPGARTSSAISAWNAQWQTWAQTTIAENTGYWKPIMGAKFSPPRLKFVQSTPTPTVGCGSVSTSNTQAMYCFGDSTIYVNAQFLEEQEAAYGQHAAQLILDHEFGHHIQHLQHLPWRGMDTELQADCLAGAALTSQSTAEKLDFDSLVPTLVNTTEGAGDPSVDTQSHGTSYERVSALAGGWNDLSSCRLTDPSGLYYPAVV
jgi:predicted metalloprotease